MMNDLTNITALALAHGFKLKTQPDGTEALNPYVFDFVRAINASHDALLNAKCAEIERLKALNVKLLITLHGIADADWRQWMELASPEEFVLWAKRRSAHAISQAVQPS